jgi:four helix bundle protein
MQDFRRLRVWHAAHQLSVNITNSFPERSGSRAPGLRSQIIRAAQSVPSNLAEGCGRSSRVDFLHFVDISLSSANELEGHLIYARDTGLLSINGYERFAASVIVIRKMLISLQRRAEHALALELDAKRKKAG